MTTLLALDCAAGACSVAVLRDGNVAAREAQHLERGHAEAVVPMIERVLAVAGIAHSELRAIAATVGPGSFTGVRIGLAAARGLALAVGAPTVAVTTLEALAEAAGAGSVPLLVVLDSKRGDVYAQWFAPDGTPVSEPAVQTVEAALRQVDGPLRLAGDGALALCAAADRAGLEAVIVEGSAVPDACHVGALAARRFAQGTFTPLTPLYLRAPEVNLAGAGGRG